MSKRKPSDQIAVCRICVVGDVRMHNVVDEKLQEIYQKLTSMPFETSDSRPSLVCYMCYERLRKCYQFSVKCMETERLFTQMLCYRNKKKDIKLETNSEPFKGFSVTPVIHVHIDYSVECSIKEELPDVSEQHDDDEQPSSDPLAIVENKLEDQILSEVEDDAMLAVNNTVSETKTENIQNDLNNEDKEECTTKVQGEAESDTHISLLITANGTSSVSTDDVPLAASKTGVATRSNNKRLHYNKDHNDDSTSKASVSKKQKLDKPKENINNIAPAETKKTAHTVEKVVDDETKEVTRKPDTEKKVINKNSKKAFTKINIPDKESNTKGIISDHDKTFSKKENFIETEVLNCKNDKKNELLVKVNINSYKSVVSRNNIEPHHTGEKPYKCDVCQCSFSRKSNLVTHIHIHTREKPYKCDICEYSCNHKTQLVNHIRIHTGEKPYKCDICEYSCNHKTNLNRHIRSIHTGEKSYKCDVCEYTCNKKYLLVKHILVHTVEKPYKCDICEFSCIRKTNLDRHTRIHTGEKPYKCDVCGYSFSRKYHLVKHIRIHTREKPYKCDVCQYCSSDKCNFIAHIRVHTGEKPYKCDICEYSCNHKANLERHIRIHTGVKPYKCDVCEYSFNQKAHLDTHIRSIHTEEKPYKCDVCDYSCNQKVYLDRHFHIHTGEKPYKCNVCEYSCNQKAHLDRHIRIHTGEKPYKCDICEYSCNQKAHLDRHIRIHTGEKPYMCDVCEYSFSRKCHLVRHIRIHTRKKPYKCEYRRNQNGNF